VDEIKDYVIGTLIIPDVTLQGLTGYTASDPRVYEWYPAINIAVNSSLPAYIVYRYQSYGATVSSVDRAELGDIHFHFDVYAYNSDAKGDVARRIRSILDLYGAFNTTNYRVLQMRVTEDIEMGIEGESTSERRYRHHVTVRLIGVLSRTTIGNVL
jgi:hypothetical protein